MRDCQKGIKLLIHSLFFCMFLKLVTEEVNPALPVSICLAKRISFGHRLPLQFHPLKSGFGASQGARTNPDGHVFKFCQTHHHVLPSSQLTQTHVSHTPPSRGRNPSAPPPSNSSKPSNHFCTLGSSFWYCLV